VSKNIGVLFSSIKMALATLISRLLGLVREQVMAMTFGAGGLTDAFFVAYRIPNLLRDLFAEGAFSAAFVPTFVEANGKSSQHARKLLWGVCLLLGGVTLFFSGMIFIFAPEIVNLFAPTFYEDPQKFEITVNLTRVMAPFLFFVSIAALFMGALNSLKVFFIPSLAPSFFNISMILCMLILPSFLMSRGVNAIYSLGIGAFIGGLLQALVQIPMLFKMGFAPTNPEKIISDESKTIVKKIGPGLIGFAATQINLLVNTILASTTIVGAVSWLNYGFRLFQLPVGILSVSIGNSNLVHFSEAWKRGEKERANELFSFSYFASYAVVLPALCLLFIFSEHIINIIFERGRFDHHSTLQTAKALRWYAIGLPFYSVYKILVPTFYALDKQKVPVYTSIFSIAVNIAFCVLMVPHYGFEVLAFGTTLSMFLNSSIQCTILSHAIHLPLSSFISLRWFKLLLATALSFGVGLLFLDHFQFFDYSFGLRLLLLAAECLAVLVTYMLSLFILGERQILNFIVKKLKRR
jgi:putative peptidoglycan lipid II flippase